MMYPYMELSDETEITHLHIIENNGKQSVEVHFERPTEDGLDTATCLLPEYAWIVKEGFSAEEISQFEAFLRHNAHRSYRFAENGGICCA
ncbi:hypothetical protein LQZ18_09750 [Lachnospiraceae bacterium ZAX-1]